MLGSQHWKSISVFGLLGDQLQFSWSRSDRMQCLIRTYYFSGKLKFKNYTIILHCSYYFRGIKISLSKMCEIYLAWSDCKILIVNVNLMLIKYFLIWNNRNIYGVLESGFNIIRELIHLHILYTLQQFDWMQIYKLYANLSFHECIINLRIFNFVPFEKFVLSINRNITKHFKAWKWAFNFVLESTNLELYESLILCLLRISSFQLTEIL